MLYLEAVTEDEHRTARLCSMANTDTLPEHQHFSQNFSIQIYPYCSNSPSLN